MSTVLSLVDTAFLWTWRTTVAGSLVAVFILSTRIIVADRVPARWQYLLWMVLVTRLVLPVFPESPFSIFNLFATHTSADAPTALSEQGALHLQNLQRSALDNVVSEIDTSSRRAASPRDILRRYAPLVWCLGTVLLLSRMFFRSIRFRMTLDRRNPAGDEIESTLHDCCRTLGLRARPRIAITNVIAGPAVFGILRPSILLPQGLLRNVSHGDLRHILLHELAHIRRADVLVNLALTLLLAIHWFNPILWYAFSRMRQDRELACDEHALGVLDMDSVRAYGSTVLAVVQLHRTEPRAIPMTAMVGRERNLRERIARIASYRRPSRTRQVLGAAVVLLGVVAGLTNARAGGPPEAVAPTPPASVVNPYDAENERIRGLLGSPVSMEFGDETELAKLLEFLASYADVRFELEPNSDARGNSPRIPYVKLEAVPLRDALQAILHPLQLVYEVRGGAIHILPGKAGGSALAANAAPNGPRSADHKAALRTKLEKLVSIRFEREHITRAVEELAAAAGVNMVVDARVVPPARDSAVDVGDGNEAYGNNGIVEPAQFESKPVSAVLAAILQPLHLAYSVQPSFVWISTQKRIDTETFQDLETRIFDTNVSPEKMAQLTEDILKKAVPTIYEPYTEEPLSSIEYNPSTSQVTARNSPTNLDFLGRLLAELGAARYDSEKAKTVDASSRGPR